MSINYYEFLFREYVLGEQFLCDDESLSSSKCDDTDTEVEVFEDDVKKEIYYNKNRMSTAVLEDFRSLKSYYWFIFVAYTCSLTQAEAMERLANSFEADLHRAVEVALTLPEDTVKIRIIKVTNSNQKPKYLYFLCML